MRVIVTGGRSFADRELVFSVLDELLASVSLVRSGGAPGADALAEEWAKSRGVPLEVFRADWRANGRAAGPIRNREMANAGADLVIAFPGGRGTANMIQTAQTLGIPVRQVVVASSQ